MTWGMRQSLLSTLVIIQENKVREKLAKLGRGLVFVTNAPFHGLVQNTRNWQEQVYNERWPMEF